MTTYKSDYLNIMHERGLLKDCTDFRGLDEKLASGMVTGYCGYDPTADGLHIGHLVPVMGLYWLQQCGGRPITLMGGGTGKVGDPSFKDAARPLLAKEDIAKNVAGLKSDFARLLDYDSGAKNAAIMDDNANWLDDLNYVDFLRDYGKYVSVNRMISMESIKRRLNEREQGLSFLEFNYMLLQAYDFLELYRRYDYTLQFGSDQWGNIVMGIDMGRRHEQTSFYGLITPLLTTASGKKMGKSEGNAVWLNPDKLPHFDFYQYWRNVEDADVERFLKIFTTLPMSEVAKLSALKGQAINDAKKVLAFEVTKLVRGEAAAKEAERIARETFEKGEIAEGLPTVTLSANDLEGVSYLDLFVQAGLVSSKGEARRLIRGGGARVNGEPLADEEATASSAILNKDGEAKLSAGKKKHAIVRAA